MAVASSTVLVAAAASATVAAWPSAAAAQPTASRHVVSADMGLTAVTRKAQGQRSMTLPGGTGLGWQLPAEAQSPARQLNQQVRRSSARQQSAARPRAAARPAARQKSAPPVTITTTAASGSPEQIAAAMLGSRGWSSGQMTCLVALWDRESGWSTTAANPSGAYGIPQALPGSKMSSAGADWENDPATQIRWGLGYIQSTYGSPCGAWAHEQGAGWY